MNNLRQVIFTIAMVIGLALSASAQKDDKRNRPPKDPAPKVDPGQKPPRGNPPPKEDKGPKRPGFSYLVSVSRGDDIV